MEYLITAKIKTDVKDLVAEDIDIETSIELSIKHPEKIVHFNDVEIIKVEACV